jgi:polysaccharide biosynthesis transport protein
MSPYYQPNTTIDVPSLLRRYYKRWLVPALLVSSLSVAYAVFKRDTWEASQAVTVRNEATVGDNEPGKFRLEDEMKAAQETILEIAQSRAVLADALAEVGPPANRPASTAMSSAAISPSAQSPISESPAATPAGSWPSEADIGDLRDAIKLVPPKGADFGKTEIFYLKVRDRERPRAIELAERVCSHLERHLAKLRGARARDMIAELTETVAISRAELEEAQQRLSVLEKSVGSRLVELRMLEQSPAGVSDLNRELNEAETEVRQALTKQSVNRNILELLRGAQNDPRLLVSAPATLFESHPNLKRMADGLVDLQLETAALAGSMTNRHPQVVSSRQAEQMVRQQIFSELTLAIHAFEAENELAAGRLSFLEGQLASMRERMDGLVGMRVNYASLTREVDHRRLLLEAAQRDLADVKASRAVAEKCSLIHRIGSPDTGPRPVGPGRTTIVLAGIAGGLIVGLGIVFISVPVPSVATVAMLPLHSPQIGERTHELLVANGNGHANDPWKNRYAGTP